MFTITATVWLWEASEAPWYFLTVPPAVSDEIEAMTSDVRRGFGSVKVRATVDGLTWSTSLFPDTQRQAYVLPLKKQVRQHAGIAAGDDATVTLQVVD